MAVAQGPEKGAAEAAADVSVSLADRLVGDLDIEQFACDQPTRSLEQWHQLFSQDVAFPIKSRRSVFGPLLVLFRRIVRPLVRVPQADLWERQRVFNLIALEQLQRSEQARDRLAELDQRMGALEAAENARVDELMRYSDALYSRVDAKLEAYGELARQEIRALEQVARDSEQPTTAASVVQAADDARYLAFENRQRGSRAAVRARIERYWDDLRDQAPVIDLGCGRGEVVEYCLEQGVDARGVDGNSAMVAHCRSLELQVAHGDLNSYLSELETDSVGAITSFHVVEHLEATALIRLLRESFRVLRPGGLLLLETPNPTSLVVGASSFWVDPTHQRPIHPVAMQTAMEQAGFTNVEIRTAQPFAAEDHLPEIELAGDDSRYDRLADQMNRLRDRLDELLFSDRDFAALGRVP